MSVRGTRRLKAWTTGDDDGGGGGGDDDICQQFQVILDKIGMISSFQLNLIHLIHFMCFSSLVL